MELDYRLWRLKPSEFNENKKEQKGTGGSRTRHFTSVPTGAGSPC